SSAAIAGRRKLLGVRQIVRRAWTDDQDALFSKFNDSEIAEKLGRTLGSVENRRTRLRVSVPKPGWRFFTPEEDALLGTGTDAEIAQRLGRPPLECAVPPSQAGYALSREPQAAALDTGRRCVIGHRAGQRDCN